MPSLGHNLTVDTANSMPATKQMTPITALHRGKPVGCQLEKYSNKEGIMTQTGTGNAIREIPNGTEATLADGTVLTAGTHDCRLAVASEGTSY